MRLKLFEPWRALVVLLPLFCLLARSVEAAELEQASFRSALSPRRVTDTVRLQAPVLVHVVTDADRFVTTPEHPFATLHGGWLPAGKLAPGDVLLPTVNAVWLTQAPPKSTLPPSSGPRAPFVRDRPTRPSDPRWRCARRLKPITDRKLRRAGFALTSPPG
jgi:hypothetical protein